MQQSTSPQKSRKGNSTSMMSRAATGVEQRGGSSLRVGLSAEERLNIPGLGSKAGESSSVLYTRTGVPRFEAFLVFAGWPNSEIKNPWSWLDEEYQPIDGIFEQFFAWLEEDQDQIRKDGSDFVATYDTVLKWAQERGELRRAHCN